MSYKEIIDNVSNIEDLDNTTILKVLEKFSKTIKDFAIEQSGLNNLVNVEFIPSDNNTTYTGDSVDYLGTLKLTLSDNIIVNKPCNIKFNIKGSNTIVVDVDEFSNSLELHLDNSVVTTLDFAEVERQKSETNGAIVHKEEIADVEHIETIYDMSSSDSNINWGYTGGIQDGVTITNKGFSKYKYLKCYIVNEANTQYAQTMIAVVDLTTLFDNYYRGASTIETVYTGKSVSSELKSIQNVNAYIDVNANKNTMYITLKTHTNDSEVSVNNYTYVYKIEGVY